MPGAPGRMQSRWGIYVGVSTALAGGVIVKSLAQRPNFFSAAVYLSQSSANLMVLANLVFVTACSFLLLLQRTLYGPLRPIEIEQLYEKAWFAVTETCLAMTIFRGEIGAWFLVMFFSLLAGKVWGWIGEGRVEVLEQQPPRNPGLFHTRLALSLGLSVLFNMTMLEYVAGQVLHMARPDMMVMFGFEFAVLTITSLTTATRYALNLIEIGIVRGQKLKRMEAIRKERVDAAVREARAAEGQRLSHVSVAGQADTSPSVTDATTRAAAEAAARPIDEAAIEVEGWDNKGRYVFYLDLATDFLKLSVYISFFFILLIFYGLPLHIMRDVFLTFRSFIKRISDFVRYRTATRDMNDRYPDATAEEMEREDVCIICRENMTLYVPPPEGQPRDPVVERMRPKKLPCGHVLHFACLRSWLERQQVCPTCRATVVPTSEQNRPPIPGAQARDPQHHNARPAAPRVYQFGPLRIGVGAARGDNMIEDLQNQLVNLGGANANGPNNHQYGIGIRWDGIRGRRNMQTRPTRGSAQDQLSAAERQIQRELDQLQASMGELQQLRNIQGQINAIRMARQGQPNVHVQGQQVGLQQDLPQPHPQIRPVLPSIVNLTQENPRAIIEAGSDQLPPGLVLPEGWTMMPLHQIPTQNAHQVLVPIQAPMPMPMPVPVPMGMQMPGGVGLMPMVPHAHGIPMQGNVQMTALHGQIPPQLIPQTQQMHSNQPQSQQEANLSVQQSHIPASIHTSHLPSASTQEPSAPRPQQPPSTQTPLSGSLTSRAVAPSTSLVPPPPTPQSHSTSVEDGNEGDQKQNEEKNNDDRDAGATTNTRAQELASRRSAQNMRPSWSFATQTRKEGDDNEGNQDEDEEEDEDDEESEDLAEKLNSSRFVSSTSSESRPAPRSLGRGSNGKQPKVEDESEEDDDSE